MNDSPAERTPETVDWYEWTKRELEQGEKRAQEIYDSFKAEQRAQNSNTASQPPKSSSQSTSTDGEWQGWPFSQLDAFVRQVFNNHNPHRPTASPTPESLFNRVMHDLGNSAAVVRIFTPPDLWPGFGNVALYAAIDEYSPLSLEQQPGFDRTWRARFEDLIRAEQGVTMLSIQEARDSTSETEDEWLRRFFVQPSDSGTGCERGEMKHSAFGGLENDGKSELDVYDHFLHFLSGSSGHTEPSVGKVHKDRPVSVTRTVDSYTEADGSTRRTEATRKTYADGRVEDTENVETIPARAKSIALPTEDKPTARPVPEKKKGWFWSS
jgi:hypothetical protein